MTPKLCFFDPTQNPAIDTLIEKSYEMGVSCNVDTFLGIMNLENVPDSIALLKIVVANMLKSFTGTCIGTNLLTGLILFDGPTGFSG